MDGVNRNDYCLKVFSRMKFYVKNAFLIGKGCDKSDEGLARLIMSFNIVIKVKMKLF